MYKSSADYEGQMVVAIKKNQKKKKSVHLSDTDNESDDSDLSGIADTSLEEWIWKEIYNVPEIKKNTECPLIMQELGAKRKSLQVFLRSIEYKLLGNIINRN
ncbi:hypothetical protein NPIL_186001 [Nephila pilipes]|uniref:Uncharacterized protein n=1 Tax=Nephila pilipes TaxID=299642 RepID=A0A8X6MNG1_NEPPI|nr:hypothetical protein NPIL_186001 [Nephila pilipes]